MSPENQIIVVIICHVVRSHRHDETTFSSLVFDVHKNHASASDSPVRKGFFFND